VAFDSLREYIDKIEKENELIRIKTYVNPHLEMAELADRMSKQPGGGKALLFENTGTDFPVLINALGSEKRMKSALGVEDFDNIGEDILSLILKISKPKTNVWEKLKMIPELSKMTSYIPRTIKGKGRSQEIIHRNPDLGILPILKTWSRDGGPFITFPQVITKDPATGIRNVGMYRMQVFEKDLCGMHWHRHKTGARHFAGYAKSGQKMPVAVALGGDPIFTYSATAPLPDNIDEYLMSGFLRKKRVQLVKAITQDIEVPENADIIIEGFVEPSEELIWEGPFGDHTGFFSLADWYPKFHITCITHRKDAVYPATVVGIPPMEDAYIALATERIFLPAIKLSLVPELKEMNIPVAGVAHNLTLVSATKTYPGQAAKIMNSMWGAGQMMFNKMMIVFDESVEIHNYRQAAQTVSQNTEPSDDIHFSRGPIDVLDHSASHFAYGSKIGLDAMKKLSEELKNKETQKPIDFSEHADEILRLKNDYPEIREINTSLLKDQISVIFISIEKEQKNHVRSLTYKLLQEQCFETVKFLIFVDFPVDVFDIEMTTWIFANNIEPLRDCFIISDPTHRVSHLAIDGTRKRSDLDNFNRDWPDIVTSDSQTVRAVDEKWKQYGIGTFIKSPSEKYRILALSDTAIVENRNEN
jgi:4-hydroxy-3-polyprenylbenzoate decarboxylase